MVFIITIGFDSQFITLLGGIDYSNDYDDFNQKNPYLAAKLISIFLEKPVIFIGYSLSDKNITDILEKIERVIDSEEKIAKLSKNMIFVTRANGGKEQLACVEMPINDKRLTFTHIKTDDFSKIYRALQYAERKIPVDFLRVFKEQIYSIVNSKEKADLRLRYIDFDNVVQGEDIDFIAGVGIASVSEFGMKGLLGVTARDLIRDIIFDDLNFSCVDIIKALPELVKKTPTYIPIRKYLKGYSSLEDFTEPSMTKRLSLTAKKYVSKTANSKSISKVIENISSYEDILDNKSYDENKKLDTLGVWLNDNKSLENCSHIKEVIKNNYDYWIANTNFSNFKRLVCIIDEVENNDLFI